MTFKLTINAAAFGNRDEQQVRGTNGISMSVRSPGRVVTKEQLSTRPERKPELKESKVKVLYQSPSGQPIM